ncbi:MAG TPA: response regulator transcription factor [Micromonosporaceae bacterium]|jgi:DNA-binding NarL/FixJ family response regulator|nr:response regulator transcription factor [Micromonosporaceae bacterium]
MTVHGRIRTIPGQHLLLEQLTDREMQVLELVAAGRRNREIAEVLKVSVKTVEFHLSNILGKLGAQSRTEAVVRAWQTGMLRLNAS